MAVHIAGLTAAARELLKGAVGKDVGRHGSEDGTQIPLLRHDLDRDQSFWEVIQERRGDVVFLALHDGRRPVPASLWPPAAIPL